MTIEETEYPLILKNLSEPISKKASSIAISLMNQHIEETIAIAIGIRYAMKINHSHNQKQVDSTNEVFDSRLVES